MFLPIKACDSLNRSKFNRVIAMDMSEERINMIVSAMGRAVMELSLANQPLTQQAITDKLEQYRRETGNVIGKGVNRNAAEIVRKGGEALD